MGDAGIALKSGNYINNLNPASYTGMDSLQILSEFGIAGKAYSLGTSNETQNRITSYNVCYTKLLRCFAGMTDCCISSGFRNNFV